MSRPSDREDWPEAIATVLSCRYTARAGRAMAFGLTGGGRFHITYNYWACGELHEADCFAERAQPVGTLFRIRYDPTLPSRSSDAPEHPNSSRLPLIPVALVAAACLWLLWFLTLRGC